MVPRLLWMMCVALALAAVPLAAAQDFASSEDNAAGIERIKGCQATLEVDPGAFVPYLDFTVDVRW